MRNSLYSIAQWSVAGCLLLTAHDALAQQKKNNAPASAISSEQLVQVETDKLIFRNKEMVRLDEAMKKCAAIVKKGTDFFIANEFDKAIDQYLEAKKQYETLKEIYKDSKKSDEISGHIDACTRKVSDTYAAWARSLHNEARKNAQEQGYDKAIELCRKAIEVYPPCKEKMEKIIERYKLMKEGVQFKKEVDEAYPKSSDIYEKQVLIRQGQTYYNTKQWDKARAKFEEVLVLDPFNDTAISYIRKINYQMIDAAKLRTGVTRNERNAMSQWEMVTPLIKQDIDNNRFEEEGIIKASQIDRIQKKLKDIIIDKISFEEVEIATAIRYLRQCSKEKDPEKIGVNFVLRGKINQPLTSDGDKVEIEEKSETNNAEKKLEEDIEIEPLTMMVDNIPLETVIKYICQQANLKYRIEDNAVIIASKDVPLDDVQTKVYPVEKSSIKLRDGQTAQDYFTERGILFEAGASAVYKEYIGRLIVTNTPKQLQLIEKMISDINLADPQVLIQTKFVEIKLNDLEELGFKYQLSRSNANVQYQKADSRKLIALAPGETLTTKDNLNFYANTGDANWLEYSKTVNRLTQYTNTSGATEYYMKAPVQNSSVTYTAGGFDTIRTFSAVGTLESNTDVGKAAEFSIYNSNGYKLDTQLYALDQADAADVLSCPRITTMNETPATIQLVTEEYFPTEWEEAEYTMMGNNVPVFTGSVPELDEETQLGISLDVTPIVEDNYTVHVLMRPLIRKFTGWDDYSYSVPMTLNDGGPQVNVPNTMLMPRIEQRTVDTQATCDDGGTIVLGGMIRDEVSVLDDQYPILGDLPLIGRLFQSKGRDASKYNLLIFLSCRLVNPDGSPLREREERGLPPFKY